MEPVSILSTIFLATWIFLMVLIVTDFSRKWKIFGKMPNPPSWPLPLVGHSIRYRTTKEDFYTTMMSNTKAFFIDQGHEIGSMWIGPTPIILVVGPNAAEVLLRSSKHIEKSFTYQFMHEWLGTGLLTSTGSKWTARRKLLTPTFHFSILESFLEVMNDQALTLTKRLERYADNEQIVDMFKPITLCALDIICETAMGRKVNAQNDSESEYVAAVYNISEYVWDRVLSPWLWWTPLYKITAKGRAYYKSLNTLHAFTKKVISDRIDDFNKNDEIAKKKRLAFLDLLLKSSEGGKVLNFQDIQEEVDTFMFEGHDTTAAGMSWATFLIGSHPEIQCKVQKELDEVLGSNISNVITMDDLKKLEYLDLVLKECLRIFPSVPLIGRTTSCECTLDGHLIPAGTQCVICPPLINNLEKFWAEPDKFDPDRFKPDKIAGQHPYAYIPFSAGPRNCIGQKFATIEEKVVLAHLLRKYSITSCDKREELKLLGDVILRPGSGIRVKLKKRNICT